MSEEILRPDLCLIPSSTFKSCSMLVPGSDRTNYILGMHSMDWIVYTIRVPLDPQTIRRQE